MAGAAMTAVSDGGNPMNVFQATGNMASYTRLSESDFVARVREAYEQMNPHCRLCPRRCGAGRLAGERGACGADGFLYLSSHNLHFGEEPPISGSRGSGTLFLANCSLSCAYCQNYPISQLGNGTRTTIDELADFMIALQDRGAHNINWVTPTHEVAHLLDGLYRARMKGLKIPVVYNSSGYDAMATLRILDGIVDIYMPDIRYTSAEISRYYSGAADYPEINRKAIKEMHRQVGDLQLDDEGIAYRGLLVRHLVLPGGLSGTEEAMAFIAREVSSTTCISLMSQFFPAHKAPQMTGVDRRITKAEYEQAQEAMRCHGLGAGWVQEMD
jgi:putative pyruvate formate lyase activating enzyme